MNEMPYGYDVPGGHRGRLPDGTWMLFSTETEYKERFRDELAEIDSRSNFQNSCKRAPLQQPVFSII